MSVGSRPPVRLRRVALTVRVTPSSIDPWFAGRREGQRFTGHQMARMALHDLDPETCEVIEVEKPASREIYWWSPLDPTPIFVFECPILKRRPDGRVLVISPAGFRKIVNADGTIGKRRRHG